MLVKAGGWREKLESAKNSFAALKLLIEIRDFILDSLLSSHEQGMSFPIRVQLSQRLVDQIKRLFKRHSLIKVLHVGHTLPLLCRFNNPPGES